MSIFIKRSDLKVKNPTTGTYQGQSLFTENDTQTQINRINSAGTTQVNAVNAKGQETLASIPDDYTELSNDVGNLKSDLKQILNGVYDFKEVFPYVTHSGFIGGDGNIQGASETLKQLYTDKIPVTDGDNLSIEGEWAVSNSQWVALVTYNASGTFTARNVILNESATSFSYDYTVPSTVGYIALTYTTYGNANMTITKPIELPDTIKLPDSSVSAKALDFSERKMPVNLFDYTSEDMCKPGWWYYSTSVGSTVSATQSGNTTHYVAIKVPVYDSTKITLGIYPNDLSRLVFWVGAVDANMQLIAYQTVNQNAPVTYTLPSGTVYFLASYSLGSANFATYLPRVMAVNADSITSYSSYFKPYYLLNGCKTEDYTETEAIQSIVGTAENEVKLKVPNNYDLVVGDTFQLFYKGIVNAVRPEVFDVMIQCSKGTAFERYFEMTPTVAETLTMTIQLYGINHNLLDEKTVTLTAHAKASSPSSAKNFLCIGDSLTASGQWVAEAYRRLTRTGGTPTGDGLTNVVFVGTKGENGAGYEAYGGWTWNTFNTEAVVATAKVITCTHDKTEAQDQHSVYKASNNSTWKLETIETNQIKIICVSGTTDIPNSGILTWVSGGVNHSDITYTSATNAQGNPFWDSTQGKVDFGVYATNMGVSSIDYVYALVGWNCVNQSYATIKEQAETFIDNVHTSFPNAKIILMGIEIPARDGLALNYGATGVYSKYYDLMQFVFNLDNLYDEIAAEKTNVYHINIAGQFDTKYNMPTGTRTVNSRNTETTTYQSNGVHPAESGYLQIADAAYRDITARL